MPGIYIHIPFCRKACNYCDFHFSTLLKNKIELVDAICAEIELKKNYLNEKKLDSVYFGGGTPSLLTENELTKIFTSISKYFTLKTDAEITFEVNPDDINDASLEIWKKNNIDRLSIGLQSFNDEELKWMNRAHSAAQSEASVKLAQDKGFDNITIDLIYGSKFQTMKTWEQTLNKAIALNTQHISSYNLTIENKTVLGTNFLRGTEPGVDDELSSQQFLLMSEMLGDAGFIHYEISNFGKEGFFAKHNSNYWLGHQYIGIGPSAHSYNGTERQWNIKNNNLYIEKINSGASFYETEKLTTENKFNEYVLTRLRTIWGCDANEIEKLFGTKVATHFLKEISKKNQYLNKNNGVYTLNNKGKLQADGIASDLFL